MYISFIWNASMCKCEVYSNAVLIWSAQSANPGRNQQVEIKLQKRLIMQNQITLGKQPWNLPEELRWVFILFRSTLFTSHNHHMINIRYEQVNRMLMGVDSFVYQQLGNVWELVCVLVWERLGFICVVRKCSPIVKSVCVVFVSSAPGRVCCHFINLCFSCSGLSKWCQIVVAQTKLSGISPHVK